MQAGLEDQFLPLVINYVVKTFTSMTGRQEGSFRIYVQGCFLTKAYSLCPSCH